MPAPAVTIVVVPRDRLSSVEACVRSIVEHTSIPIKVVILDFGYPNRTLQQLGEICADVEMEVVDSGLTIPMDGFREFLPRIETPFTCWVDNDTFVTEGCIETLLRSAEQRGLRAILPLTLELEGLDIDSRRLEKRVHISHAELRKVTVSGREYVFDCKPNRRAAKEDIPVGRWTIDFFEMHTFFAETELLKRLEWPSMVVREQVDIGIQLHGLGIPIWCESTAEVRFDNLHTRPTLRDIRFFFYRWGDRFIDRSHDLFEERHGWRFYNEQFMKNWAFRRRVFSVARFLFIPHKAADLLSRVFAKFLRPPIPAELSHDPTADSVRVFASSD